MLEADTVLKIKGEERDLALKSARASRDFERVLDAIKEDMSKVQAQNRSLAANYDTLLAVTQRIQESRMHEFSQILQLMKEETEWFKKTTASQRAINDALIQLASVLSVPIPSFST